MTGPSALAAFERASKLVKQGDFAAAREVEYWTSLPLEASEILCFHKYRHPSGTRSSKRKVKRTHD